MKLFSAHRGLLAAAGLLTLVASGCAVSDQLDLSDASVSGSGGTGSSGSGSGGSDQGTGGGVGTGGSVTGTGGTTGAGGIIGTGGSGTGGSGTGGSGTGGSGTGGRGTGGNGTGGIATGGTTGTGGIKGTGGLTGTGGMISTGGTTGTGGLKGTGGTTTTGTGGVKGTGGTGGAAAPTFTQVYSTILVSFCGGSSCHNPGSQKGVSFSSQSTAYTAVKSRVTAGNGAGSSFYTTCSSGSMPPGGPKLSATNLALLKAWIDAGALNN
jgi:hypothetical protein